MKINNALLKKLEEIFKIWGFQVRFEKGTFTSGYCILEDQQVIVINKFFPLEGKVNVLLEIVKAMETVDFSELSKSQAKLVSDLRQKELEL